MKGQKLMVASGYNFEQLEFRLKKILNILIIEDFEDDTLLITEHIKNKEAEIHYERIETEKSLRISLYNKEWDVILADYNLPDFNALEALKVLHEKKLDIPFIVVSGTIGEDITVSLMKKGALGYIMKDNLTRLYAAISRETKEAKNRAVKRLAEQELGESMKRLDLAVKAANIGTWDFDFRTGSMKYNKLLAEMLGYNMKELENDIKF